MSRADHPTTVEAYLENGCGRCPLFRTPECKAVRWADALRLLCEIARETGTEESIKWGVPCYAAGRKNVFLVSAFRDYVAVSFFKGALLADPDGLLVTPGPNTQGAKMLTFRAPSEVADRRETIRAMMWEAVALEKAGKQVTYRDPSSETLPVELEHRLESDPELRAAFDALTPSKRRGYALHIAAAKQSETRLARIERCVPKILAGKAFEQR